MKKQKILEILTRHSELWLKNKIIKSLLLQDTQGEITDAELRKIIAQLRLEGNIIIAGSKGYMLTNNIERITKYIKSRWGELTREMKPLKEMAKATWTQDLLKLEVE